MNNPIWLRNMTHSESETWTVQSREVTKAIDNVSHTAAHSGGSISMQTRVKIRCINKATHETDQDRPYQGAFASLPRRAIVDWMNA